MAFIRGCEYRVTGSHQEFCPVRAKRNVCFDFFSQKCRELCALSSPSNASAFGVFFLHLSFVLRTAFFNQDWFQENAPERNNYALLRTSLANFRKSTLEIIERFTLLCLVGCLNQIEETINDLKLCVENCC